MANESELFRSDRAIQFVIEQACLRLIPNRILIFGSHARGDNSPLSDYDIAIETGDKDFGRWATFAVFVRENLPSLHSLDLVHLDTCSAVLRERILKEGILLYERSQSQGSSESKKS